MNWDTVIHIHSEESRSLYEFMIGNTSTKTGNGMPKKDAVVAKPLSVSSSDWKEKNMLQVCDFDVEQVYKEEAAGGKFFINKLVGTAQEPRRQG